MRWLVAFFMSACAQSVAPPSSHALASAEAPVVSTAVAVRAREADPVAATRADMRLVHDAVEAWRQNGHEDECPSVIRLKTEGGLADHAPVIDAWGGWLQVVCEDDATLVRSAGSDRRMGTSDDLVVP